jgi:hypothetical protein
MRAGASSSVLDSHIDFSPDNPDWKLLADQAKGSFQYPSFAGISDA